MEKKNDLTKDTFYVRLEYAYERDLSHNEIIVLGVFNARVEQKKNHTSSTIVGKLSFHDKISPNVLLLKIQPSRQDIPKCPVADRFHPKYDCV